MTSMTSNPKTCLDFLGQEIKPGDTVVYPGRQGSRMWMNQAQVLSVDQTDRGWGVKVQRTDGIRTLSCVDRIVVVSRSAE